jgi:hypothetical protein
MSKKMKCLVKTLHLLSACLWLGAATGVVLLQCLKGWSEDGRLLLALNQNLWILDLGLIIPGAMGSALTGLVMCSKTNWGFTRYWWVITKWILTISAILVGTVCLGPLQLKMVALSERSVDALIADASYGGIRIVFTAVGFLQVITLVCIITLSALKPWGKRIAGQAKSNAVHPQLNAATR